MTREDTDPLPLERIPDITIVIIVAGKEDSAGNRKCDRSNSAQDIVVLVCVELTIRTEIKQFAACVVGSCRKGVAVGEKSDVKMIMVRARWATYWTALISDS